MFRNFFVVIVLSGLVFITDSKASVIGNETKPGGSPAPKTVSCFTNDGTVAMQGNIPNPYNCQTYYTCAEVEPGYPKPVLMNCQNGHDGLPLYYDFKKCWCDQKELATCYDFEDEDHVQNFFGCATELESWDGNNSLRK